MKAKLLQKRKMSEAEPTATTHWKQQLVSVQGKQFTLGQVEGGCLYHGSGALFAPGELLEPGHGKNFRQSADLVSITSDASRAVYWAREAGAETVHLYEVEPIGPVNLHRVGLADQGRAIILWEGRAGKGRVICEVDAGSGS